MTVKARCAIGWTSILVAAAVLLITQSLASAQTFTFSGDVKAFISAVSPDRVGKVIEVAALDYDARTGEGTPLRALGKVVLSDKGIVEGSQAKSGWVNQSVVGTYPNLVAGKSVDLRLRGVSFWINEGGSNWIEFVVEKALLDGREVAVTTGIEGVASGGNRPYVVIDGKYRLVAMIAGLNSVSLGSVPLVSAAAERPAASSATATRPTCNDPCKDSGGSKECKDFKNLRSACTRLRSACASDAKKCPDYGKTCQQLAGCVGFSGLTSSASAPARP